MVKYHEDKKSIMGFNTSHTRFFQVYVSMPTMIPQLKRIMEEGITPPGMYNSCSLQPFETNVPFVLRFMIDQDITGAGWLTMPKNAYSVRAEAAKKTHCQIEVDISFEALVAHKCEGEVSRGGGRARRLSRGSSILLLPLTPSPPPPLLPRSGPRWRPCACCRSTSSARAARASSPRPRRTP
jgi:DNA polymerase elongation subunit (family B)